MVQDVTQEDPAMTTKTAADYTAAAQADRAASQASFDRSDTDGCLSQWAHDTSARLNDRKAEITAAGRRAEFVGLYTTDGRRVAARKITNDWGTSWLLRDDEATTYGRRFIPTGVRSRVQRTLGLVERTETAPAHRLRSHFHRRVRLRRLLLAQHIEIIETTCVRRRVMAEQLSGRASSGSGGGPTSVYVKTFRTGDEWGLDATACPEDAA